MKNWISTGSADYYLVVTQTDKKAHHGITTFLVEKGTPVLDMVLKKINLESAAVILAR